MKTILIILFSLLAVLGLKMTAEHEQDAHDLEIKKYHSRYLELHPFTGDQSYEDFDYIFGHQDDEFYTSHQCVDSTHERCDGNCECDGYECSYYHEKY